MRNSSMKKAEIKGKNLKLKIRINGFDQIIPFLADAMRMVRSF